MQDKVDLSGVSKKLKRVPKEVRVRLLHWKSKVEYDGLIKTKQVKGYHDEALQGQWFGFRSVRLGRKWRLIYKYHKSGVVNIVEVKEVNAHEY